MTNVFGAASAGPLIYELRARLPAVRDASVLLISPDLGQDPNRNKIVSEALEASARGALMLVQFDGAQAPIGLRDVPSMPWTPGTPGEKAELMAIAGAIQAIKPAKSAGPQPAPMLSTFGRASALLSRRMIAVATGSVLLAALVLMIVIKSAVHAPSPSSQPPPPTFGAISPNGGVAEAEQPNASPDTANDTGSLNSPAPQQSPTPESQSPTQTQPGRSQVGVIALLATSVILLLAVLALQALILLTQLNGAAWLRESRDKLLTRLPLKLAPLSKFAGATQSTVIDSADKGAAIFASYSRKDRDSVDPLILDIEQEGLPVWLDRVNIAGGAIWPEAIVQAIRGARTVVVFCSPNAFNSDNVLREINLAASYGKSLLPIVLAPSEVPDSFLYYLATCQFVDLSADPNWRGKVLDRLRAAA